MITIFFFQDGSGELEFSEFITCYSIFDTRNKKDIPILFFGLVFKVKFIQK